MEDIGSKGIAFKIKKPVLIVALIILLSFFTLELQVMLNSPIVFGDEGFHAEMALWMATHLDYPKWVPFETTPSIMAGYSRPPMWNLLQASFLMLSGMNDAALKILPPLIGLLTGIAVYLLVKRLYNSNVAFLTAVTATTLPSMVTYAVLSYYSMLSVFYFVLFFFLFILSEKTGSRKYLYLSSIFAFLSFMTNQIGLFGYFLIFIALVHQIVKDRKILPPLKKYGPLFLVLILLLVPYFARNLSLYKTPACFTLPIINTYAQLWSTSGCNVNNIVSQYSFAGQAIPTGTEQTVISLGIMNYFNFAYGSNYFVNIFILGIAAGILLLAIRGDAIIFPVGLTLLMLVVLFIADSHRSEDLARYTLEFAPILALTAAIFWNEIYNGIKKYQKYVALIVFVLILFISYSNLEQKLPTMLQIKQFSPSFLQACAWIKSNTPENATFYTVWGHNAAYSCSRNMATNIPDVLLASNVSYELQVLQQNQINYIFLQKFSIDAQNQGYAGNYPLNFVQMLEGNPQYFQKVYENGPDLSICIQQGGCDGNIVYKVNLT